MMAEGQSLVLYFGFILAGLVFILIVWAVARFLAPRLKNPSRQIMPLSGAQAEIHHDAVLVIEIGGRVRDINPIARDWFDLASGEYPNLEKIIRRVRPGEEFLKLCAGEGQARFSINGRLVEGYSYRLPVEGQPMMLTLRRIETSPALAVGGKDVAGSVLRVVTDFSQAIASSLDLEATVAAILENIERLVPSDYIEVKTWNETTESLTTFSFSGTSGVDRNLEKAGQSKFSEYTEHVVRERKTVFIADANEYKKASFHPADNTQTAAVRSYLGFPLLTGGELIGTLEVGVAAAQAFSEEDKALLELIVGQAGIALHNALLYEAEQKRARELLGLANLAQSSTGSLRELHDLYERLVGSLALLFDVEIIGFLYYDETRRMLVGQVPFQGLPPNVVEVYKANVAPDSPLERFLQETSPIITANAAEDARWLNMGMADIAQAASLRDTVLMPLVSGGRSLGFVQLSNHRNDQPAFSKDELRLLLIASNQLSTLLENVVLVQQSRTRIQRSESLRRISNLVASTATLDEIFQYSMREVAQLLQSDFAAVFIYDEAEGWLRGHIPSAVGVTLEQAKDLSQIYVPPSQFKYTVTGSLRSFLSGHLAENVRVLSVYKPLVDKLNLQSAIVVPLTVRNQGVGELMVGSYAPEYFDNNDMQLTGSIASQISIAVERSRTVFYSDESLIRRVERLSALSRVIRVFDMTTDINALVQAVYDEGIRISGADCGSIIFFDSDYKNNLDVGISYHAGHKLDSNLLPLELDVLGKGEAVIIDNYAQGSYAAPHPDINSSLCVPVIYQGNVNGLIHLHARGQSRFDQEALEIARTLAVQAAISFGNALRLREEAARSALVRRRADTLAKLFEVSQKLSIEQSAEDALYIIAEGIREATPFDLILFSVYEPESGLLRRVASTGIPAQVFEEIKSRQQPWKSLQQLLKPEFKIGAAFFIPNDQVPVIPVDVHFVTVETTKADKLPNSWDPDDMLLVPLIDSDGNMLGLASMDNPRDGMRPDRTTIESLEVFLAQAALTLSSINRVHQLRSNARLLSEDLLRQQDMVEVSQSHLPALLHKDLQQTIAVSYLDQRSRRVRAGLDTIETISRQLDGTTALLSLGREILTRFNMNVSIVAEDTPEGPRLLHVLGNLPRNVNPESMFGQRNPLRSCLQTGETILSFQLEEDETWHDTPLLTALRAKSFVCLPVIIGDKTVAAVMATNFEPMPAFSEDDRQMYFQIARQISVILQNIKLFSETRKRLQEVNLLLDFSRQISGLDPVSIVSALLASALKVITSAHAGAVLLWDDKQNMLVPRVAENYADIESLLDITYRYNEGLIGRTYADRKVMRVDEVNFAVDYNLPPETLLKYRKATAGRLPESCLLVPIQTSETNLGVLILDNFNASAAFRAEDEILLLSLTQQVALSLENVRLVQFTEARARQLQALNDVASTISSSLQREQLVAELLEGMGNVVPYDTAILWLRKENRMVIVQARGFDGNEQRIGLSVGVEESALLKEMTTTGEGISVPDVRNDPRFPSLIEPQYLSWLGIPLITKDKVMGVVALEKAEARYYTRETVQLATTFASQAAVALENAALYEDSVSRAAELDERSKRLALLNKFSADLSTVVSADQILRLTGEQLRLALEADHVAIIGFNSQVKPALWNVLPEEYSKPVIYRSLPSIPLFERMRQMMGVFTSDHIAREAEFEPLQDILEGSESLMVLPVGNIENLHAFFIQTTKFHHFTPAEIELARIFANQAGIALENAKLYETTLSTAEQLRTLNQASFEVGASLNPEDIYKALHRAVEKLMPVEAFVVAILDEASNEIDGAYIVDMEQRITGVRIPPGQGLSGRVIASGEPLLTLDARDADKKGAVTVGEKGTPHSILAVPIFSGSRTVGMMSAQSYQYSAYTQDDLQILSTLANQASIAIQNGRLFAETQNLAATLEQRVHERTAELQREQRNTETLLQILTEVSASLDLDRALSKTLALLNEAIGAEQGTVMLLNPDDNMLHFRAGYGYASSGAAEMTVSSFKLKVGEGLAGWVVKNRQSALVEDLHRDPRWVVSASSSSQHRSAIVAPMMMGDVVSGAIMVFHRQVGFFTEDALEMVKAIGSQVAISINNAQLYELIRDQAERLGGMLRDQAVEASRQTAILEAVADGVLVTDSRNHITFLNVSAERILRLKTAQVLDQPLEMFGGLFGKATQSWSETIRSWSDRPSEHRTGDTYAEQIMLEDGRVVLVHLAPVIWKREFLGTVSIFRDITHEVEVDRLKSEFVATVSHELRTPMTSIRGYVDIMLMGAAGALNDNQKHFLEIVKSNTERLNVLVNDLLDISRIEAGRVTLSFQALDVKEIIDAVVADVMHRSRDENKPMSITIEVPDDLPRVLGDLERVRQVISNLVDNAYNYSHANSQITVSLQHVNDTVQVDVTDSGIGVALEAQERVFERFYRGEDLLVLATPGTGLGLSIVKQLVEMHGGKIWMYSTGAPGEGSTFSFTLPAYHPEE